MRIVIIGHFEGNADEGEKNVARALYCCLSKKYEVKQIEITNLHRHLVIIKKFKPNIIHLLVGPSTIYCFIVSKFLSLYINNTKILISALQPNIRHFKKLICFLKPDLILTQSNESNTFFEALGCKTRFFPNGVDTKKFYPPSNIEKQTLREKYGFNSDTFIVLHVGHIVANRNLRIFNMLNRNGIQTVIVGSTTTPVNVALKDELIAHGCLVIFQYIEKIEDIYKLSDCYFFPTHNILNSIEMPLSVMEAMSCNLPVISSYFGVIPQLFNEGDGLYFFKKSKDAYTLVDLIKQGKNSVNTRKKILNFSWERLSLNLVDIYRDLNSTD